MTEEEVHRVAQSFAREVGDALPSLHPDLEGELFPYVDGKLGKAETEIVESHLEECALCREDVADLRQTQFAAGTKRRSVWRTALAIAAGLALAIIGLLVWSASRRESVAPSHEVTPPVVRVAPEARPRNEWDAMVDDARRRRGIGIPEIVRRLRGERDPLRGGVSPPADLEMQPAGVVVASQRPQLSWRRADGERYVVTIECGGAIAAQSEPVAARTWTPPLPLPRGLQCLWTLERESDHAILPAPPAPQPAFAVLGETSLATIERAKRERPGDDFLIALLYARDGVRKEAEEHLRTHLEAHPEDDAASAILNGVRSW